MDHINLEDDSVYLKETNNTHEKKNSFNLSNPIFTEMLNFNIINNDIQYEFRISYKNEKWQITRKLSEIKNLICSLKNLKYVFFNEKYFINLKFTQSTNLRELNMTILSLFRYINYRYDILSNIITRDFFSYEKCTDSTELLNLIQKENLEQIFNFKKEASDMTMSDFSYNSDLGLLTISLEDVSYISRIGRFWSLIDYEVLGSFNVYQRIYDKENRPYFRKLIIKNFDIRVTKIELNLNYNKIYVGLENGNIQIFIINFVDKNSLINKESDDEKILTIVEGNNFKVLSDRITGLVSYKEFLIICSKDNKLIIADLNQNLPEIKFNGSLKKRIQGKGHITNLKVDYSNSRLFVVTYTNKILIFDIVMHNNLENDLEKCSDIRIEFLNEIDTLSNIKDIFIKGTSLFIGLDNKIQIFTISKENLVKDNIFPLDGSMEESLSYSAKYITIGYKNYITSICYFIDMKIIVLGLADGTLMAFNSRSIEVIFAKRISDCALKSLVLLEENYILIAADEKGSVYFFRIGN